MNGKVSITTLGCRVNQYESEVIAQDLEKLGYKVVYKIEEADAYVINTCTVTAESDRKSRQLIRNALKSSGTRNSPVIVTGCYTETGEDVISEIDGINYVIKNKDKSVIASTIDSIIKKSSEITGYGASDSLRYAKKRRSYIKIEDGCENRCAYCIIPKARGPVISRKENDIFEEAVRLVSSGCKEIILTGIETASYGADFKKGEYYGEHLASVIKRVSESGIERISLGSLDPSVMNDRFIESISDISSLVRHFHLSIQSGSGTVLKRMRRKYNADQLIGYIDKVREMGKDITLSCDIITGFPGETDMEFEETLNLVRYAEFLHLHVFPYSDRDGTEASKMENKIPFSVKKERLHILEEEGRKIKNGILDQYLKDHKDNPVNVLFESKKGYTVSGHSEHFIEVLCDFGKDTGFEKEICKVALINHDGDKCYGKTMN